MRWKHKAAGRISGAATVVGDIVYFGDLKSRTTTGLGARTGRKVFSLRAAAASTPSSPTGASST